MAATRARARRDRAGLRVAVVAATGWYYEPFHAPELADASVERLTDVLVREIESGLDGTGIRPGVLGEVGSHGDRPSEPRPASLRAAARAADATGPSVATHAQLCGAAASPSWNCSPPRACPRTASPSATRTSR